MKLKALPPYSSTTHTYTHTHTHKLHLQLLFEQVNITMNRPKRNETPLMMIITISNDSDQANTSLIIIGREQKSFRIMSKEEFRISLFTLGLIQFLRILT